MPSNRPRPHRSANRRPAAPASGSRAPRPGGTRRPGPSAPSRPAGVRGALERVSFPLLVRLTQAPKWLVGAVTALLLLGGLLAPRPWGPLFLGVVTLFLAWLLVLSWPRLDGGSRAIRSLVVVVLAAVTYAQAFGLL